MSLKSTRFDSPANNVGPWPASLGCTNRQHRVRKQLSRGYRFKISQDKDPHNPELQIYHVYIPVSEFAHGRLPDKVNPRSHEDPSGRIPELIAGSLKENPTWFHLLKSRRANSRATVLV
jgi:hypothetical protein